MADTNPGNDAQESSRGGVGFIGLGTMGSGMVKNLIKHGVSVVIWNRTAKKMEPLLAVGALPASSAEEVAQRCQTILLCVSDTPDVVEVVEGERGVISGLEKDSLVVDHSTISPTETHRLAELVRDKGASWLDAPVSGGSEGAERGTLSVMIGGEAEDVERARPWMEAYSSTITHVGPTGSGQLAKLVNQVLVVTNQLAASEALLLAQAGGLDLEKTIAAVKDGAGGSWMFSNRGPQMIDRDWRPGFTIDLQQKDLRLVLEAADQLGIPLPATALVFQLYRSLQSQGLGAEGNHALVKALENLAGMELGR